MKRDLHYTVTYPHPPAKVWRAITDPAAMSQWLMPNDFAPRVGHEFRFRTKPAPGFDGIVHCTVVTVDEPRTLAYTWRGGGVDTLLTFTLEAEGPGTKLTLEQKGFHGIRPLLVSLILGKGWTKIVHQSLPAYLERMNGN